MPSRRIVAVFCAIFVAALIMLMPLRAALTLISADKFGLSARAARGTVWHGHLVGVSAGGLSLGDFDAGLSPLQLLRGKAALSLVGASGRAVLVTTPARIGVDHATLTLSAGTAFAPLPIKSVDLSDVSVRLTRGRCSQATGQVKIDLAKDIGGINLGQGMVGTLRCEGAALTTTLVSQSAMERIMVSITPAQGYRATIIVRADTAARVASLTAAGFREGAQGMVMQISGVF